MTPVSSRYALPLLIVLGLASLPVLVHSYVGVGADDCLQPEALRETAEIGRVRLAREHPDRYVGSRFQWTEGVLETGAPGLRDLGLRIERSFEPSRYYLGPTAYRAATPFADREELRWVDVEGQQLPIHLLTDRSEPTVKMSVYMYVYDGKPVAHPFPASLGSAPWQLLHGTRPLTFYLTYGSVPRAQVPQAEKAAIEWLADAWDYYSRVCAP